VDQPVTLILDDRPARREHILRVIGKLPTKDGQVWDIRIGPYVQKRTLEQNARLHLIFSKVAALTGGDIESVKLGYKALFLAGKEGDFAGRKIIIYPRTSKMNKAQLREFMEQVEAHAISEFGVILGDEGYR